MTVKQAAQKLGISVSLVYGLVGAGKIRHERHGLGRGTIRIPEDALEEYRRRATKSEASAPRPKNEKGKLRPLRT
jgi:excisionase family DNA binding protein